MNFKDYKEDFIAGFLVFLIALPLCLGIAAASGFPPIAGIVTAGIGGVVSSFLGSSRLTIKGPAAGLIVIVLSAVQELGGGDKLVGYRKTLAACVLASFLQIGTSLLNGAVLTQVIPLAVIHGMLAAIGVIIIIKQIPILLGAVAFKVTPLLFFTKIPELISQIDREEALIGVVGLLLMFGFSHFARGKLKKFPAQMIVLFSGVLLALFEHLNPFSSPDTQKFFVRVPEQTLQFITYPDFSSIFSWLSLKHSIFLFLVCSIESLLTVNAVDSLNKEKRVSNLNSDLFSTGVGNLVSALLGGLPMISEIVRSRANIDNGAKTSASNFFHGCFLLISVIVIPNLLDRIPLACLAAMLIYTGTKLASVQEFMNAYKSGRVHLCAFLITLLTTLATDLLTGVLLGFVFELIVSILMAEKVKSPFDVTMEITQLKNEVKMQILGHVHFINFISINKRVEHFLSLKTIVTIDLSSANYVDSTSLAKFQGLKDRFSEIKVVGIRTRH